MHDAAARGRCSAISRSRSASERHRSSRSQSTKTTLGAEVQRGERRGHERVGRAQHDVAGADPGVVERGERRARPAPDRDRADAVALRPRRLEPPGDRALRPLLGVEDLVPQRVQARAVALIEADREAAGVGGPW